VTLKSIPAGAIKRVHVNQHKLRQRLKDTECTEHCYTIKHKGKTTYAYEVYIEGPSELVERISTPLSCGARLWLETEAEIVYKA